MTDDDYVTVDLSTFYESVNTILRAYNIKAQSNQNDLIHIELIRGKDLLLPVFKLSYTDYGSIPPDDNISALYDYIKPVGSYARLIIKIYKTLSFSHPAYYKYITTPSATYTVEIPIITRMHENRAQLFNKLLAVLTTEAQLLI